MNRSTLKRGELVPVILSGGSGTRLWPLSRESYPKQFLPLISDDSLFQSTINRLHGVSNVAPPLIVCNEIQRFLVAEQARKIGITPAEIILEPVGRNTAPAVACAALIARQMNPESILLVLPSDHIIKDVGTFQTVLTQAINIAQGNKLVTFGIVPSAPQTGFGYMKRGEALDDRHAYSVDKFIEKPSLERATEYVDSGEYYWNSGMFVFRADLFLSELEHFAPEILAACQSAVDRAEKDLDFLRLDQQSFTACPKDSIDYAVMEKTDQSVVVPLAAGWNDIGSWSALWEISEKDGSDNVLSGDVLAEQSNNCFIHAGHRLVATVGLNDHVVIETSDSVFVAPKSHVQQVKSIVEQLSRQGRSETICHKKVYRPWGSYESIYIDKRFQVKMIIVNPKSVLSLQMHHHRAEHWVVVHGTARVTRGDEIKILKEDQSTYIPLGVKHRLENPGIIPLELIEVQTGSYLGEDDIVRFEDEYGRNTN
ncbi:MAG: mannose-1-phosphate guanylyltransferase/mannose-6-phosphate isomerase [Magnetococcales bacterium]|nr:mannose-1-phosphate guanylyltransferase/mannose-6-phosphate isomerase [Magnetococcales bacterium]